MTRTKKEHLESGPTKRILALDGGGIRGILTLQFLAEVETILRERTKGGDEFRLCDYFDLIGGTSTGAIIAAALACGMSIADLQQLYLKIGESVFDPSWYRRGVMVSKFPDAPLRRALNESLGKETTLDSDRIRTGLMIMTKRLDTGSPWPLHNHPRALYYPQDGKLLLTDIVRASTAAPTFFAPQKVTISARNGSQLEASFVDGGVSPHNDPALQLLMLAALDGHGFRWQTGKERILLVSVGTGTYRPRYQTASLQRMLAAKQGIVALQSLMDDCARGNQAILQWLTHTLTPWTIDRAVGDMQADSSGGPSLATYVRYNVLLDEEWLREKLGVTKTTKELAKIAEMDQPSNIAELMELGKRAAKVQVKKQHFDGFDA